MKNRFINFNDDNLKFKGNHLLKFNYSNIYKDGFIVQGFCISDIFYLVSAYYHICNNKKNSRIYFYKKDTGEELGYVVLNDNAHVGGISFDDKNRIVFVTGKKGKINAYTYDSLIKSLDGNYLKEIDCSEVDISNDLCGNVSAATLNYYDNSLYVCTCSCSGSLIKYDIKYDADNNKIKVLFNYVYRCFPSCIQGIVSFNYQGKIYFVISQSYSKLKSILKVIDIEGNVLGQKKIRFIGLEGIDLDSSGNIHCVFENGVFMSNIFNINSLYHNVDHVLEYRYFLKGKKHQSRLDKNRC